MVGLKPSDEKFGIFTIAVNYCEQIITFGKFHRKPENYEDSALVDVLKVRLFSPESKSGGTNVNDAILDEDFNPIWGKARDLENMIRYYKPTKAGLSDLDRKIL